MTRVQFKCQNNSKYKEHIYEWKQKTSNQIVWNLLSDQQNDRNEIKWIIFMIRRNNIEIFLSFFDFNHPPLFNWLLTKFKNNN